MEHVVDMSCCWESELINNRGKDLCDSEGSFAFRSKFEIGDGVFKVPGFKPDFISFGEGGEIMMGVPHLGWKWGGL